MKPLFSGLAALGLLLASPLAFGQTLNFGLSNSVGSQVKFDGNSAGGTGTITFTSGGGANSFANFGIGTTSTELAGLQSLIGSLDGTFTIGTLTGSSAPVTGAGTFTIADGSGGSISAALTLEKVTKTGTVAQGFVNNALATNLTSFSSYSGSNLDLQKLAGRDAVFNFAFQFAGTGPSLAGLTADGSLNTTTSFNGTVSLVAIPEPPYAAIGLAVPAVLMAGLKLRRRFGSIEM